MKLRFISVAMPVVVIFALMIPQTSMIVSSPVYGQSQTQAKTSADYIQNARNLLKQVSTEYKGGNYSKAEELAGSAYLDNFEYAEADLQKHGQSDLVGELEKMMVTDLRGMIRDKVSQEQLDAEIVSIDAKLAQAYAIVPEFPTGAAIAIISVIAIGSTIAITRLKSRAGSDLLPRKF